MTGNTSGTSALNQTRRGHDRSLVRIPPPFLDRLVRYIRRRIARWCYLIVSRLPGFTFVRDTEHSENPRLLSTWIIQKIIGINREAYWPVHFTTKVNLAKNVILGVESNPGINPGCYIQAIGKIDIGDYCYFGPNVGIMAGNHNPLSLGEYIPGEVSIGSYSWVGMGALILPGVKLGDCTVVGAGAVVTKSFPEGYCIIAGNPARKVRDLFPDQIKRRYEKNEYHGYIAKSEFQRYRQTYLRI